MVIFRKKIIFAFSVIAIVCIYIQFNKIKEMETNNHETAVDGSEDVTVAVRHNPEKRLLFQSNEAAEFPTVTNRTPRIPHIIHQICHSEMVLDFFVDPIQSFDENNPTWMYRFWTYESGRKFLTKHYPYLVDTYDEFGPNDVKKSDLLRTAVIHEYGGMYADLDVMNLRSLNITTFKYACIVPTEPFEHSAIGYKKEFILSTTILLCRPKHPFFKELLLNLQIADTEGYAVVTTGPVYITSVYLLFYNITDEDLRKTKRDTSSNSPYFYKGLLPEDDNNAVYIPNSQYFMDNVDTGMLLNGKLKDCLNLTSNASELLRRGCNEFEHRKALRESRTYTFTYHYWFHMWTRSVFELGSYKTRYIGDIIPRCVFYEG